MGAQMTSVSDRSSLTLGGLWLRGGLTDDAAVPALQGGGGAGHGAVGAGLSGHVGRQGGAGAPCGWRSGAAGQGGAWTNPLVVALRKKTTQRRDHTPHIYL